MEAFRTQLSRLAALAAVLGLVAAPPPAHAQPAVVEVPVVLPVTGFGAFLGQSQAAALTAVEQRVNATGGIRGRIVAFSDDELRVAPLTTGR